MTPQSPARVLLVDDDPVFLMLARRTLEFAGFSIEQAFGGREALALVQQQSFDAVVLDALMPEPDGFEVCRRLRALQGFEHLPVLMITGLDDEDSIARASMAGATDFLGKSAHGLLLVGRLRHMLRAALARQELESSRSRLARAHALARMGSCSWIAPLPLAQAEFQISPEALIVLGLEPQARGASSLRKVLRRVHPADRRGLLRLARDRASRGAPVQADVGLRAQGADRRVIHLDAQAERRDALGRFHYVAVIQDVTHRRVAEDRIRQQADFDALTGLPNRRQILWRAEQAMRLATEQSRRMGLLLIDLDDFKRVNDTLGHAAGDELLAEVARRLRSSVRHRDHCHEGALATAVPEAPRTYEAMGRLGGDEFLAVLPDIGGAADLHRVARRIRQALAEPFGLSAATLRISASIGMGLYPRQGQSVADLLDRADSQLYANKALRVCSGASAKPGPSLGDGLAQQLRLALERDEFLLHYQPAVDVVCGRIVGVEALMRWRQPGRLAMPQEFIGAAQASGLIVPMTHWALRQAAHQAGRWHRELGFSGWISVNLPACMLGDPDLVDRVRLAAADAGVDPSRLLLEVTESGQIEGHARVDENLRQLRGMGVQLAVDDFGTGYSCLAYLGRHPFTELKLDRGFVRDLGAAPRVAGVLGAVMAMARALELRVVAEGVETPEQMQALRALGCTLMQGHLFSPALGERALARLFRRVNSRPMGPWQAHRA